MFFRKKSKLWTVNNREYQKECVDYPLSLNRRLSQNTYHSFNGRKTCRNNHLLYLGDHDDMLCFARENIARANINYVVTDHNRYLYAHTVHSLTNAGYSVVNLHVAQIKDLSLYLNKAEKVAIFLQATDQDVSLLQATYMEILKNPSCYTHTERPLMLLPDCPLVDFCKYLARMIKYNIHMIVYAPNINIMQAFREDDIEVVFGVCDTWVVSGAIDEPTITYLSQCAQQTRDFKPLKVKNIKKNNNIMDGCDLQYFPKPSKPIPLPLPKDDECFIFLRCLNPIRDTKLT